MLIDTELNIEAWLSYENPKYPTLVLRSDKFGVVGYDLNPETGDLERCCICSAWNETECICGAWDISNADF